MATKDTKQEVSKGEKMKIQSLTAEQEQSLPEFREKWRSIGLCTDAVDHDAARNAVRRLYRAGGLAEPSIILVLDSPMAAQLFLNLFRKGQLGGQLADQLLDNLVGQLRGQLLANLGDQLGDNLRDRLVDQLSGQLSDNLRDQLWTNLRGQLVSQLVDNLGDQLWENLEDQLRGQLAGQLKGQLLNNLKGQLGGQLGGQLVGQLRGQLRDQLRDQLVSQLWDQLWDQLGDQLRDQLGVQLVDQLGDQLWGQLEDQLRDRLEGQLEFNQTYFWSGQDAPWLAFYDFGRKIGVEYTQEANEHLDAYIECAHTCGWLYLYPDLAVICGRPEEIHFDTERRLHCETGTAIKFRDGWSVSAWHGVRVPCHWIAEKDTIDPSEIIQTENVEQRAAGAAIVGWNRMLTVLNETVIDDSGDPDIGALIELTLPGLDEPGRFLKAECPRNGTIVEGVPRVSEIDDLPIETAIAAQAWRIGDTQSEYEHPPART